MAGGVKAYIRSACNVGGPPRTYPLWGSSLSGGIIAVLREGKAQVDFCPVEPTATCGVVTPVGEAPWVIEGVYAKTSVVGSRTLWKAVLEVMEIGVPSLLVGDFNYIVGESEKIEGAIFKEDLEVRISIVYCGCRSLRLGV